MRYALLLVPVLLLALTAPATADDKEVPNTNRALYSEKGRRWKYSVENWELDENERKKREKAAAKKRKKGEDEAKEEVTKHDFTGREKKVYAFWEYEVTKVEARQGEYTFRSYTADGELDTIQTNRTVVMDAPPWSYGTATEIRKETLTAAGVSFECAVCDIDESEFGSSRATKLEWRSLKYPGLVVRSESYHPGTPDVIGVQVLTEVSGFGEVKADPAAVDDAWRLYRKQGRKWRVKHDSQSGGRVETSTYTTYEVTEAGKDSCKLKTQMLKVNQTPAGAATTTDIKFDKDSEHLVKPAATAVEVRKEKLQAAGRDWQCIVYEDKKALKGTTITTWMAEDFPGLRIKRVEKSDTREVTATLDQFTE